MKVCLINNLYFPYARGGAEKIVKQLAKNCAKENHEAFVISTKPYFSKKTFDEDNNNYYLRSFFDYLKYCPRPLRAIYHFWNAINFVNYWRIKAILKKEKPDVVITHNLVGIGFLTPNLIKKLDIKYIHYLHDIQLIHPSGLLIFGHEQRLNSIFCKIYTNFTKKLFSHVDKIVASSKWILNFHIEKEFFKSADKKISALKQPSDKAKKITKTSNKFVYVGQVEKHKGILFLIEVFNSLSGDSAKKYQLDIIGDGVELKTAKKLAKKNNQINFLGYIDNKTICNKLGSYDALIVPSLCYENSPVVIQEANSHGLPVVASDIGGIPEIINTANSYLLKPGDKRCWVKYFNEIENII